MEIVNLAFRRAGDSIDGVLLVKAVDLRASNNGSKYADFTLIDATGEINAKAWNWGEADLPKVNSPIRLKGTVTEFNGKPQLRIDRLRDAKPEEVVWGELVPTAPLDANFMYDELYKVAKGLENEELSKLAVYLLEEKKDKLLIWPAAVSFHHAQRGGLLYHTYTMVQAGKALLPVYPSLNESLLLTGVIAHDLCKMEELEAGELGLASLYSKEGNLLGHIVSGVAHLKEVALKLELSQEVFLTVSHMVLSHHEIPEYGSPKAPMFLEAQMLHILDLMDARMNAMTAALSVTAQGEFSDRVRPLDNRRLYNPQI